VGGGVGAGVGRWSGGGGGGGGGGWEGRVLDSSVSGHGLPTGSVKCKQFLD
jgi:hypothetical protein